MITGRVVSRKVKVYREQQTQCTKTRFNVGVLHRATALSEDGEVECRPNGGSMIKADFFSRRSDGVKAFIRSSKTGAKHFVPYFTGRKEYSAQGQVPFEQLSKTRVRNVTVRGPYLGDCGVCGHMEKPVLRLPEQLDCMWEFVLGLKIVVLWISATQSQHICNYLPLISFCFFIVWMKALDDKHLRLGVLDCR